MLVLDAVPQWGNPLRQNMACSHFRDANQYRLILNGPSRAKSNPAPLLNANAVRTHSSMLRHVNAQNNIHQYTCDFSACQRLAYFHWFAE